MSVVSTAADYADITVSSYDETGALLQAALYGEFRFKQVATGAIVFSIGGPLTGKATGGSTVTTEPRPWCREPRSLITHQV